MLMANVRKGKASWSFEGFQHSKGSISKEAIDTHGTTCQKYKYWVNRLETFWKS